MIDFNFNITENCEQYCWKLNMFNIANDLAILLDVGACVFHNFPMSCWKLAQFGWVSKTTDSKIASINRNYRSPII